MTWSHALVTGGAGFIGSHLTRALLAEGRLTLTATEVLDGTMSDDFCGRTCQGSEIAPLLSESLM